MRKPYKKPQITKVKLAVEEAVLTACKMNFGGTSGPNGWEVCGYQRGQPIQCQEIGS